MQLSSVGTTVSSHTEPTNLHHQSQIQLGRERFLVSHGLEVSFSPFYSCAKPLKPKQGSVFRFQRRNLENCSQCPHQVRHLKIKQPATRRHHTGLILWPASPRSRGVLCHFPAVPPNLLGSKPCMGSQPTRGLDSCFWLDCHRTGRLPAGSLSQEPATAAGHLSHPIQEGAVCQW